MSDFDGTLGPKEVQPGEPGHRVLMWRGELNRAGKAFEAWEKDGERILKRYALDGDKQRAGTKINMLWSNVETLAPALYAKPPKMVAARRFLDKDPVGRVACRIIQRAVQYQVDGGELHQAVQMAVMDRLLPGRGQAWCRYEPTIEGDEGQHAAEDDAEPGEGEGDGAGGGRPEPAQGGGDDLPAPGGADGGLAEAPAGPRISAEVVHVDYVHWRDFRHDPQRTWDEVQWVARRSYLTRDELKDRFGDKGADCPLTCGPDGEREEAQPGAPEGFRKAEVWEIWHKQKREVVWLATGADAELDVRPDPYGLEQFFPCPRPLYATVTNGSLVPTADFLQYEDQADQLDEIAERESGMTSAMRVVGGYDAEASDLARILKADDLTMLPIDDLMSKFSQGGGASLSNALLFLPLDNFAKGLEALAKRKAEVKADAFEVTGLSDIMRGQGDPDETATGVQTKGHFATLRLKRRQAEVAAFVRDLVRIMAEMTCELFQPETLAEMASAYEMDELQVPAPMPSPAPGLPGAGPNGAPPPPNGMPPAPNALPAPGGPPMMPPRLPMMAGSAAAAMGPGIGR